MRFRRHAAVLVLAFTLAPWVAGADARLESRARAEPPAVSISEFLSHAWNLFTSFWEVASVCDEGHGMDPLGCPAQPTTDEGHGADPLG